MIQGKNFIGNKASAMGGRTYQTFNPQLNTENQPKYFEATAGEIEEAVSLANQAFDEYRKTENTQKAIFLEAIADEILALDNQLIQTYCDETGLPEARAIGERGRMVGQLRTFASLVRQGSWVEATIDTAQPQREPMPRSDIRKMMVPLGPVVVFGASNFPFAFSTAGGDTASALAAGCPVIVKSHPMHAGTGELLASAIIKAAENTGMPNGVFSNLNSADNKVGTALVEHPGVKAVGFTGSTTGGKALFELASKRPEPIPVFAEMGSINPVILLPAALEKKSKAWAQALAGSITMGTGQFCTNPGLLLGIKNNDLDNFTTLLAGQILEKQPGSMLHPRIKGAYDKGRQVAKEQDGTHVIADYDKEVGENHGRQMVLTVSGATFLKNTTLHQEVFGPFSLVVACADAFELEVVLDNLEGQLTGTILAEEGELEEYHAIVEALKNRVGRIIFNGVPTGVEVCAAMQHGGPYPASTDSRFTAVGIHAIKRWVRPLCYQDWPQSLLPAELRNENPLKIIRLVDTELTDRNL